jgi:hypothetical protein
MTNLAWSVLVALGFVIGGSVWVGWLFGRYGRYKNLG